MNVLEAILNAQGGGAVRQLGQQFGLQDDQVGSALSALVPALAAGFQKNLGNADAASGLLSALGSGSHQRYVDDTAALGGGDTIADGNAILGQIFGSKDVSRRVASRASSQTGIGEDVLKQLLPVAAAMMMGTMSKHAGPAAMAAGAGTPDSSSILGMLMPMLDSNRDGSVVDDVVGIVGKMFSGR